MSAENNIVQLRDEFQNDEMNHLQEPFVGMKFGSPDEAYEFYKSYSCKVGFGINRRTSHNFHGFKYDVTFCCNKCRPPVNVRDEEGYRSRCRGVVGTGCRARIVVRDRLLNGNWCIEEVQLEHNHELRPDCVRLMRCHSEHEFADILQEIQTQNSKMLDFFQKSPPPSGISNALVPTNGDLNLVVPAVYHNVSKFPSPFEFFDGIFPGKHFPESVCIGWDQPKSNKILSWDILTPNQQKTFQAWFNGRIEPTKTQSLSIYQTSVNSNELYLFLNGYPSIDEIVDSLGLLVYATCRRNDCPWLYVPWTQVGYVPQASAEDLWSDVQYKWTYDGTLSKAKFIFMPFVAFGHWMLIQYDFERERVVVWNTLSSKDLFEKDTLVIIEIRKKWIASVLLRGDVLGWDVEWNHTVQQGCSNDCGIFIMKIMECIVTNGNLGEIDQAYISRVKVQAVYNILAVQFYRHLLPDVYNLA